MAFTVDLTGDVGVAMPFDGSNKHFVVKKVVDFSEAANHLTQNQIMGLLTIPGGVLVREVIAKITTSADSDTTTFEVGACGTDESEIDIHGFIYAKNQYQATVPAYVRDPDVNTHAIYALADGTAGHVQAADWVLTFKNTDSEEMDNGVIEFMVICIDLR
jgi:hypothetical protein